MDRSRLTIVIPCYNEALTIGAVVAGARLFGDVIVIDDGSTDGSRETAKGEGAEVVSTGGRTGYDAVVERGLRESAARGGGWTVTMDADGEHDPGALADFARIAGSGEVGLIAGRRPSPQRAAEHLVCGYCRRRFGISDILCGMKGYSALLLAEYFADGRPLLINMWPALLWASAGKPFAEVEVGGVRRVDQPRFQSLMRANWKILGTLPAIAGLPARKATGDRTSP